MNRPMASSETGAEQSAVTLSQFLETLFGTASGLIEVRALPSKVQRFIHLSDEAEVQAFMHAHHAENLYLGVASRRDATSGKLENCQDLAALFVDIDFKLIAEPEARRRLAECPLPPSLVVHSGGGLHVYWRLREPLDLQDEADRHRAKALLRRLALYLHADMVSAEPAHILRLPGTKNFKYAPPRPVLIESYLPDHAFNLDDFESFLPEESSTNRHRTSFGVPEAIPEGQRNDTLYRMGRSLIAKGFGHEEILALLTTANRTRCTPPMPQSEVEGIVSHLMEQPDRQEFCNRSEAATANRNMHASNGNTGLITELSDEILRSAHFAQDDGGLLYVFEEGAYRPHGKAVVEVRVKRLLETSRRTKKWKIQLAREVAEYLRVDAPWLWAQPPLDTLNLRNGLLNVETRILRPHDPAHLSPIQLPLAYDPTARCPAVERFIEEVFPSDCVALAYEIAAWLMRPDLSMQIAVLLVGEGSNGKSTWLTALINFLGTDNIATLSLRRLETDKFAVARLVGKLANICPDLPSEALTTTSTFKAILGGDRMMAERKFQPGFDFTPYCRLVFSSNSYPQSQDASHAFFRRWLVIPFERSFSGTSQIARPVLDAQLAASLELSGLLNKALDALTGLAKRGAFTQTETTTAAWAEFRDQTDPLAIWLERYTVLEPDAVVSKKDLRIAYGAYADEHGHPRCSDKAFAQAIKRLRPRLGERQRTIHGQIQHVYLGLRLQGPDHGPSQGSQHSHLPPQIRTNRETSEGEGEEENTLNRKNPVNAVNPVNLESPDVRGEAAPLLPVGTRIRFNSGLGFEETGTIEAHTTWNYYAGQPCYRVAGEWTIPHSRVLGVEGQS